MTNDETFNLSRRTVLAGLGTIGVASAGAGLGTTAYFSDREEFTGNQLVAGELDLKVDWQQTYYGPDGWVNVNAFPDTDGDDVQDDIESREEIATRLGTTIDDPAVEEEFRAQFANVPDDVEMPVIELDDVKPGDEGELTFSIHVFDNPAYIWFHGALRDDLDNGQNEPESAVDPDGDESGELAEAIMVDIWADDGDNVHQEGEMFYAEGVSLSDGLTALSDYMELDGDPTTEGRDCFENSTTYHVGFRWWLPAEVGNEVQSDSVSFDLGFYAEQCRHNDGTLHLPE